MFSWEGMEVMFGNLGVQTFFFFFFSSRRRHTRLTCDWSSDVCSSDLVRRLVRALHGGPVREKDVNRVVGLADGNPFYVEELVGAQDGYDGGDGQAIPDRSEERRVGKECRSGWAAGG